MVLQKIFNLEGVQVVLVGGGGGGEEMSTDCGCMQKLFCISFIHLTVLKKIRNQFRIASVFSLANSFQYGSI